MNKTAVIVTIRTKTGKRKQLRALWDEHLRGRVEASAAQRGSSLVRRVHEEDGASARRTSGHEHR